MALSLQYIIMRRIVFVILLLTLIVGRALGQTTIKGHVLDTKGDPLVNVTILIQNPSDSTVLAFGNTSQEGYYSVAVSAASLPQLSVTISGLEIKPQSQQVENKSQIVNFTAEYNLMQISEVVVEANKVWQQRDTINYLVSSFTGTNDISIGDVIKKLPGLTVSESGSISYMGREINKLYIENMDLLKGRYGIATKNLRAEDISVVQVLENYQPIKMMDGIEVTPDAAINLKLKEGAKNVFSLQALLGAGIDNKLLWKGELVGMLFNRANQNITTVKSSNAMDISSEDATDLKGLNEIESLALTDIAIPASPPIKRDRYIDPVAHSLGSNQLFKLKNTAELTLNLQFTNRTENRHSYASSTYDIPNSEATVIEEELFAHLKKNTLQGGISYTLNRDNSFLGNETTFIADWLDNRGESINKEVIKQRLSGKSLALFNSIQWGIKNKENKGFALQFDNAFRTQPHNLYLHSGLYPELINGGAPYTSTTQTIRRSAFLSALQAKTLSILSLGSINIDPTLNVRINNETLFSDILRNSSERLLEPKWSNDMSFLIFDASLGIELKYLRRNLSVALRLPLSYRYARVDYRAQKPENTIHQTFKLLPSISVTNKSRNLQWDILAALSSSTPGLDNLYKGYILQNYRVLNRYASKIFDTHTLYTSANVDYKLVEHILFLNSKLSYRRMWSNGILSQSFQDQLSVTELVEFPNKSDYLYTSLEASKGFYWKDLIISLVGYWSSSRSNILRQGLDIQHFGSGYGLRAKVNIAPFEWCNTEYVLNWNSIGGRDTSGKTVERIHNMDQYLSLIFDVTPDISLTAKGEHYYNGYTQGTRNFFLADLSMVYSTPKVRYQLDWNNIFNTKTFATYGYGSMSTFYSLYHIRPAALILTMRFKVL